MNNEPTMPAVKFTYRNGEFTEYTPGPTLITLIYHNATIDEALKELAKGAPIYVDASDTLALAVIRAHRPKPAKPPSRMDRFWRKVIEWYWS